MSMFSIHNVYIQKANTTIDVTFKDKTLSFIISPLISKRNKADLDPEIQLKLLNAYLDYKGEVFKEELFNILEQVDKTIIDSSFRAEIYPLEYGITYPILDFFDKDDIYKFLKDEYRLTPPSNLPDVFDEGIEQDGRGSRVQTYLKTDYLELASLALIMKVVLCPLGSYAKLQAESLGTNLRDYILFQLIKSHPIYNTPAMQKLYGLVSKLIDRANSSGSNSDKENTAEKRILEKSLPLEEIPDSILGSSLIQKVAIAPLVDDNADKNIITKIYNFVNTDLKSTNGSDKAVSDKKPIPDTDSGSGDSESMLESYKMSQDISNASRVEMDWAIATIERVIQQLPNNQKVYIDMEIVNDAYMFIKPLYNATIKRSQIAILSVIFKTIIDPRSLDYITMESLFNLFAVGFSYLWKSNCKQLAILLCSVANETNENEMQINVRSNIARLKPETKEALDYYFPYKRTINSETDKNMAEEAIDIIAEEYFANTWVHLATDKYMNEVMDNGDGNLISTDIKLLIADFIIKNESLININSMEQQQ